MTKQNTAVMQKVHVFLNDDKIGYGYIFYRDDGRMSQPDLYFDNGAKLPQGWYQLVVTNEYKLVVMARSIQ